MYDRKVGLITLLFLLSRIKSPFPTSIIHGCLCALNSIIDWLYVVQYIMLLFVNMKKMKLISLKVI